MIAYDIRHVPPAAVVQVMIANVVHEHRRARVSALLDTGSDVTAIPRTLVERLQLYPISHLEIEGLAAITTSVFSYAVQLSVAGLVISRLEVVLTGLDFVVLGRDVLNHLYVLLNGPELTFELATTAFVAGA